MFKLFSIGVVLSLAGGVSLAEPAPRRVAINITKQGFAPDRVTIRKDEAIILAFTRKTDATCAKEITVDLGDGHKVSKAVPLDGTIEIPVTFHKTGELQYACAMDMVHGIVVVQ